MLRLTLSSLLGLALFVSPAAAQKETPKKDVPTKADDPKKEEPKGQVVKIKSVDAKTNTIIVTNAEGKTVVLKVNPKDVNIVGPRGGKSEGFEDDRMKAGLELTLFYTSDGKTLKEIRFAVRKSTDKDK